jgi:CRP-like cAMP-binding protein
MPTSTGNHLLDRMSPLIREQILAASDEVDLPLRSSLFKANREPSHLHFLTTGMASQVVAMQDGSTAEVSMTGKEGLAGSHFLLGSLPASAECFMQIPGTGLRVPLTLLRALFETSADFRGCVLLYVQSALDTSLLVTACSRLHEAEPRLARWLLMTADRAETNVMRLTQEFLAEMLGTQRTTVALVAGQLRDAGLIDYTRGKITILNREGLEKRACECYRVVHSNIRALRVHH